MPSPVVADRASYAEWKREPTTTQVLFSLNLPYRPPRSLVGNFFWRRRVWLEVTFALSMLQPWEKFLVMVVMYLTLGLLLTAIYLYLPQYVAFLSVRASYYLFGRDPSRAVDLKAAASASNLGSYGASWGSQTLDI